MYNNHSTQISVSLHTYSSQGDDEFHGWVWWLYFKVDNSKIPTYPPFLLYPDDSIEISVYHNNSWLMVPVPPQGDQSNATIYVEGNADALQGGPFYDIDDALTKFTYVPD